MRVLVLLVVFMMNFCKDSSNGDSFLTSQYKPLDYKISSVLVREDNVKVEIDLPSRESIYAVMQTTKGDMILELYDKKAPKTVQNFVDLATGVKTGKPFYDDLTFHRVIKGFMIQGGCPLGNGTGGPGYKFEDEINAKSLGLDEVKVGSDMGRYYQSQAQKSVFSFFNVKTEEEFNSQKEKIEKAYKDAQELSILEILHRAGYRYNEALESVKMQKYTLAMANAGPNTNGSQFFINEVDNPHLNGLHTVFGKLVKGFDVLDKIANSGNNEVKIEKLLIIDKRSES